MYTLPFMLYDSLCGYEVLKAKDALFDHKIYCQPQDRPKPKKLCLKYTPNDNSRKIYIKD